MRLIDLAGSQFGYLTVIKRAAGPWKRPKWICSCKCGKQTTPAGSRLKSGQTKSCGCLKIQICTARLTKHGHLHNGQPKSTYRCWHGMISRCFNPSHQAFSDYGERGIKVCAHWQQFDNFLADMGSKPDGLTIDRIDNNGNYSCGQCEECRDNGWPANCRWTTMTINQRNRRDAILVTIDGKTHCVSEWAEILGVDPFLGYDRIRNGWNAYEAITTPKRQRH